ncbi:hypothetical protein RFM99_24715 [Mesorhizobium sp. VK4C]|uniref:hypothetical protein n=1 Tax=Mesorhizobium captivum TaxID=3072319 RepID=UPI002A23F90C|nr:hypothetical protein [Mesorhizobium sp. VK4C]MDX8501605.1 hypothetical protein [Mesorhizobium sp. VK4C]
MTNGSNAYGIKFSQISWFDRLLGRHPNVVAATRHHDIVWDITRKSGCAIQAICLDEYTCGTGKVLEVREEFPEVNLIYVGGMWNGYTMEAKEYCLDNNIGLFNTTEMTGALHKDDFWKYHKKDKDGNPVYP